jgi:hypothetical protein
MRSIQGFLAACGRALLAAAAVWGPAAAQPAWQEAALGAAVILPPPAPGAAGITGGTLSCAEQRWQLRLATAPGAAAVGGQRRTALLTVGNDRVEREARVSGGALTVALDADTLELIKAGSRLTVAFPQPGGPLTARFALDGSRQAIDAAAPRCSTVDLSAFRAVAFITGGPDAGEAERLVSEEVGLFQAAVGMLPNAETARLELGQGRALLFVKLCGSTRYYGTSGCNLTGWARQYGGSWRQVYDTDGMMLLTDPHAGHQGFPDLVTLPAGSTEALRWQWNGSLYEAPGPVVAEDVLSGEAVGQLRQ